MESRHCACLFALLAFSLGSLTSCLDYREELWLESNGSGKIHATIAVNSVADTVSDDGRQGIGAAKPISGKLFHGTADAHDAVRVTKSWFVT